MLVNHKYISIKVNELQMQQRNEALFILLSISNLMSQAGGLETVLDEALARVLEHFDFDAGRIYLLDGDGELLKLAACRGIESAGLEVVRLNEGFSGKAARTGSFIAQYVSDLEDKKRAALLLAKGFKIIICVPLIAMGQVLGVMNMAANKVIELDQDRIDLLVAVGNQIAVAAHNAKLNSELKEKFKELKIQKDAIEYFAYSISHDLKSPAIGIYGLTQRLHRLCWDALDYTGREYCNQIMKAADQILKLVDKINTYIVAKEAPMQFETVALKEITTTIRNEFADTLDAGSVRWKEPDYLPTIIGDKISITRVLRNLVDNALKYGGDQLSEITIEYKGDQTRHIILVSDDGVALSKENSERLFRLFQRDARSKGVPGAGLGLAIVKEIVERHGGEVWLDTEKNGGTTFAVAIAKNLPEQSQEETFNKAGGAQGRK